MDLKKIIYNTAASFFISKVFVNNRKQLNTKMFIELFKNKYAFKIFFLVKINKKVFIIYFLDIYVKLYLFHFNRPYIDACIRINFKTFLIKNSF